MKRAALICLVVSLFLSCNQGNGKRTAETDSTAVDTVIPLASAPYFYAQLKGTVGDQQVTMQLLKTGPGIYRGYYAYDKTGQPIDLWGSLDGEKVILYENNHTDEENSFVGKLTDNGSFEGIWHGNKTSFPFKLATDLQQAVRLQVYYATDSIALLPGRKGSPMGTASNMIVWPPAGTPAGIRDLIIRAVSGSRPISDPEVLARKEVDSFLHSYRASVLMDIDTAKTREWQDVGSLNWTSDGDMKVVYNTYPLLVLESFSYDFTGGAHGNGGSFYTLLDLDKKQILKPEDVFKGDYKAGLAPLLDQAFREQFHMAADEPMNTALLVDSIPTNDNFFLTGKGVAFSYTPYEIGPYALGQVTLFLPYTKVRKWLKSPYDQLDK